MLVTPVTSSGSRVQPDDGDSKGQQQVGQL